MAFALFLVYLAFSFIRPFEIFPDLAQFNLMMVLGLTALAAGAVTRYQSNSTIFGHPLVILVAAFVVWAMFSVVAAVRWFGGASTVFTQLSASLFIFYLIVFNIDRLDRLRTTLRLLVVLAVMMAAEGIMAYHFGYRAQELIIDEGVATSSSDLLGSGTYAGTTIVLRIRHRGFLGDPNDLAQALISILPFVFAARPRGGGVWSKVWVIAPTVVMLYAVVLTRSRGGLLALLVLVFLALRHRLPAVVSLGFSIAGGFGLLAMGFLGGRSSAIDASAESRTEAWRSGWEMLKGSPIWGVGFDFFTDHHQRVAHNSFVHCFAELGLVGYWLWLGILVIAFRSVLALKDIETASPSEAEVRRYAAAIFVSLSSFMTAAFFLSRTYATMLFLLIGLAAALAAVAARKKMPVWRFSFGPWAILVASLLVGSILFVYLVIRVAP